MSMHLLQTGHNQVTLTGSWPRFTQLLPHCSPADTVGEGQTQEEAGTPENRTKKQTNNCATEATRHLALQLFLDLLCLAVQRYNSAWNKVFPGHIKIWKLTGSICSNTTSHYVWVFAKSPTFFFFYLSLLSVLYFITRIHVIYLSVLKNRGNHRANWVSDNIAGEAHLYFLIQASILDLKS